uniref:Reverse transcriptase domain-containing protein n=1 Tax=Amphiprion ocellaris TaxID=80972 RepID=A0AAQ5ZK56_AMPOC
RLRTENPSCLLHNHILENRIDLMCLTETWHKPEQYSELNEACPTGYAYLERARTTGRQGYGGLAVIYRSDIRLTPVPVPNTSTFECLAFKCEYPTRVTVILIYRPPKPNSLFLSEIHDLLMSFCSTTTNILILGDFNIHVDSSSNHTVEEFLQVLDCFDLKQHVDVPTHDRGHTLDLVITDSLPVKSLQVFDMGVSDHCAVSMELPASSLLDKSKRQICFRNLDKIDQAALSADLKELSTDFTTAEEAVQYYNTNLHSLLDSHAPVRSRTVTYLHSAPWFTPELRKVKTAGRILERRYVKSGLTVHKIAYRDHQKHYSSLLSEAKSVYYSNIINKNSGNSKQLFTTINHLLKPRTSSIICATQDQCNNFCDFFSLKVDNIRGPLSRTTRMPLASVTPDHSFADFVEVEVQEIESMLRQIKPSTCALDPLPSFLIKCNTSALSPLITTIINCSLRSGHVPSTLKTALIKPHLKKHNLNPQDLASYRPISNLPFLSKVLEKVVAGQLHDHLSTYALYEKFQSGFRLAHSTETALVRVTNDLLVASDQGSPSLLILLDLTAAFDTVDHNILLHRLQYNIGLSSTVLDWFKSFLAGRTEYVVLEDAKSRPHFVTCGVPQGSVLGPTLFNIYMLPLGHIIGKHGMSFHCYADDTQLYLHTDPTSTSAPSALIACLEETKAWLAENFLQLNASKTEAILIGTPHQLKSSPISAISLSDFSIPLSSSVRNLGVIFDPHLSFEHHIQNLCKISFFHLKNISKLRPTLSLSDAEKLVHAFVSSRLDYCNALLVGIPAKSLLKLQHVQNTAARILTRTPKQAHITPVLHNLHWLPIAKRIQYKICLLAYQCIHGHAPDYLSELLTLRTISRQLRSTNTNLLCTPRSNLRTMGDRAFQTAAPELWNTLPPPLRAPQSLESFKKGLKTFLFKL